MQFFLTLLFDTGFGDVRFELTGVNHLPVITRCSIGESDGFAALRALLDDPVRAAEPLPMDLPAGIGVTKASRGPHLTRPPGPR